MRYFLSLRQDFPASAKAEAGVAEQGSAKGRQSFALRL